jgi:hypothetical protein
MKDVERVKVLVREIEGLPKDDPSARPGYREFPSFSYVFLDSNLIVRIRLTRSMDEIHDTLAALLPKRNLVEVSYFHSYSTLSTSPSTASALCALFRSVDSRPNLCCRCTDPDQADFQLSHQW